jgi:hypothetical protein
MDGIRKLIGKFKHDSIRELTERVEKAEQKAQNISRDLHASQQRNDTLYRLVKEMRGPNDIH